MTEERFAPVHPGEVLLEEFLKPMRLSQNRLALNIGVHPRRINEIVLGKRSISADTALRLARFFGNAPQFWMSLQADYDLDVAKEKLGIQLERVVRLHALAGQSGESIYEPSVTTNKEINGPSDLWQSNPLKQLRKNIIKAWNSWLKSKAA